MQQSPAIAACASKSRLAALQNAAVRLPGAEKGSVATVVGLSMLPLALALGLAVDGGMAYGAHSRLQGALDAAVLASARVAAAEEADVEADARMYFDANFPKDFLGSDLTGFDVRFDQTTGEVSIDAEIQVPTAFMRIAGVSTIPITAEARAQTVVSGVELALVLDVTGSMNRADPSGGTKLQALKNASGTLLDVIYGDNETVKDVSMAVIPYNTEVNLGSDQTGLLTGFDEDAFGDDGWKGCVEARAEPFDRDDTPPSEAPFTALLWPEGEGTRYNPSEDPNAFCPDSEVLPLTAEKSVIADHIDDLEAEGFTMTNVGFTWGWRTISPRWRAAWGAGSDRDGSGIVEHGSGGAEGPVDYDHPSIKKAIIFMTDGVADWSPGYYTSYGFLGDGRLGTTNESAAESEVNDRLLESCELAKDAGIEVYTVMFALNNAAIERDYRACATSDQHFFDAPDGEVLDAAFRDIAGRLTALRLTQ